MGHKKGSSQCSSACSKPVEQRARGGDRNMALGIGISKNRLAIYENLESVSQS